MKSFVIFRASLGIMNARGGLGVSWLRQRWCCPPRRCPAVSTMNNRFRDMVVELFLHADVIIDGHRPWDLKVHDERFYERLFRDRDLALGESYLDGWWSCEQID